MKNNIFSALSVIALLPAIISCSNDDDSKSVNNGKNLNENTVFEPSYTRHDPVDNNEFTLYDSNIITKELREVSGIVSGRKNKDIVYMHEDSGNRSVVFVYDYKGVFLGEIVLGGIQNRDWEDIAIGPGPKEGINYIYVADFGDNRSVREEVRIYRFPEPDLPELNPDDPFKFVLPDFETITYQYPDGPRDAETLLLEKETKDLIVVTKREVNVHVYKLPFPQATEGYAEVEFKGKLPFRTLVGGDISPDGTEILIKDYGAVYHWINNEQDIVKTLFTQTPTRVEYIPEVQGESIGWSPDGNGYFTITEIDKHETDPVLYYYRR